MDQKGVTAEEMLAVVDELKAEHAPKYDRVRVEKAGQPNGSFSGWTS